MISRAVLIRAPLLLGALLAACAHNPEPRSADSAPVEGMSQPATDSALQEVELSGRVVNSGTGHFTLTTLQVEGSAPTQLVGEPQDELRTLAGAQVRVRGVMDPAGPGRTLRVREYELLSINGQRPRVGKVIVSGGSVWLAASDTVRLIPELSALRERAGAKVWVVGSTDPSGRELHVESYGVIAPAP